jgi:hypothetical protein
LVESFAEGFVAFDALAAAVVLLEEIAVGIPSPPLPCTSFSFVDSSVLALFVLPDVLVAAVVAFLFFVGSEVCSATTCSSSVSGSWSSSTNGFRLLQAPHRRFLAGLRRVHDTQVQDPFEFEFGMIDDWRWRMYGTILDTVPDIYPQQDWLSIGISNFVRFRCSFLATTVATSKSVQKLN